MQADVCRDELLFEIELDAMASRSDDAPEAKESDGRESEAVNESVCEEALAEPKL